VRLWCLLRDEHEEHLGQEVILDSEDFLEVGLHRLQSQVLSALFLLLGHDSSHIFTLDGAECIEKVEDVRQEVLIYLAFQLIEILVSRVESLNVVLSVHALLHLCDEFAPADVVNKV